MLNSFLAQYREFLPALDAHLDLLERWNKTVNLTAIRDRNEAMARHIGESLFLASHLPAGKLRICDLGSGGGFPGIPVAIVRPDCDIVLVESDVRKGVFLREASRKLPNVQVATARFETLEGEYDWLISRAVNLAKVKGGPHCLNVAFLGKPQGGRFQWHSIPIPWDIASELAIGNVSRETSVPPIPTVTDVSRET